MYDYRSTGRFPEKEGTAVNFWDLRVGVGEGLRETFGQEEERKHTGKGESWIYPGPRKV